MNYDNYNYGFLDNVIEKHFNEKMKTNNLRYTSCTFYH